MIRFIFVIAALLISFTSISAQVKAVRDAEAASILRIDFTQVDPKLKVVSVTGFPDKTSLVTNRARTFKAFVLCVPTVETNGACNSRVFITDITSGKTSVITGESPEAEVMRPIGELKWLDNERLSYERWMNPHYGHRYVVNVRTKKQVGAWILSDGK